MLSKGTIINPGSVREITMWPDNEFAAWKAFNFSETVVLRSDAAVSTGRDRAAIVSPGWGPLSGVARMRPITMRVPT
jgi:hypothetical protein